MRVVVVVQLTQVVLVLAVLVAGVTEVRQVALTGLLVAQIPAAVVALVTTQELVVILVLAVRVSLLFLTPVAKEALAAQSHQAVATLFIHLHLAVHLQLNLGGHHGSFC
jgi:hypothetical protein